MRCHSRLMVSIGALVVGLMLAGRPAVAECNPDTALFADDFASMDNWGEPSEELFVKNGALFLLHNVGVVAAQIPPEGANLCVDATIVKAPKPEDSVIGVVFWLKDWENFYFMFGWSVGQVSVGRTTNGKFNTLFAVQTPAFKKGNGQTNNIELRLRPNDATLVVNGTEIKRFKGKPPEEGGWAGVIGISPDEAPATFKYDNFILSPAE